MYLVLFTCKIWLRYSRERAYLILINFSSLQRFNFDRALASEVGSGGFGTVVKCTSKKSGAVRACKKMLKRKIGNQNMFAQEVYGGEWINVLNNERVIRFWQFQEISARIGQTFLQRCMISLTFLKLFAKFRRNFIKFWIENRNGSATKEDFFLKNRKSIANNWTKFCWAFEVWAMRMHLNLVDLVKSFPTSI